MRPKRHAVTEVSPYKYTGYIDTDGVRVPPHVQCEENGDHQVTPTTWPPQRTGLTAGDPSLPLQCDFCAAHLIVYEAHRTGKLTGITVVVPGEPRATQEAPEARQLRTMLT